MTVQFQDTDHKSFSLSKPLHAEDRFLFVTNHPNGNIVDIKVLFLRIVDGVEVARHRYNQVSLGREDISQISLDRWNQIKQQLSQQNVRCESIDYNRVVIQI